MKIKWVFCIVLSIYNLEMDLSRGSKVFNFTQTPIQTPLPIPNVDKFLGLKNGAFFHLFFGFQSSKRKKIGYIRSQ